MNKEQTSKVTLSPGEPTTQPCEASHDAVVKQWGISAESLDHNKPPPPLILKIELFAFLAIFVRYPLMKT